MRLQPSLAAVGVALSFTGCGGAGLPDTRPKLPDGGFACEYVPSGVPSCCQGGSGCGGDLWCNTARCACEDVESPCALAGTQPLPPDGGPVDAGPVPSGTVAPDGGTVERLWFATTGDTRPGNCNATGAYPTQTITRIARGMKALRVQFAVDLGDHMFVCDHSPAEAGKQMDLYMGAVAQGPATFFMTMGNHECGSGVCLPGSTDANFQAYMAALRRPKPWYSFDVATSLGVARFAVIADDAWGAEQAGWLETTLADADKNAKYTIVARHHPMGGTRKGNPAIVAAINRHKHSLILTAHSHAYARYTQDNGGRAVIVGVGGAPGSSPYGFGTVLQETDGRLTFTIRDIDGHPWNQPWSVGPQ
jgi:hypothetical protein